MCEKDVILWHREAWRVCVCVCVCVCVYTACQVVWQRPRNNIRSSERVTDKTWLNDVEVRQVNHSLDVFRANHLVTVTLTHVQKSMLHACWELSRIAFVRQIHERLVCLQHRLREEVGIIAQAVGGNKYVYVRAASLCKNTSLCSYLSTSFLFHFLPFLTCTSMHCTLYWTSNNSLVSYLRLMPYYSATILWRTMFLLS